MTVINPGGSATGAVTTAPASSAGNTIQSSGDFTGFVVKKRAGQTTDVWQIQDDTGVVWFSEASTGVITSTRQIVVNNSSGLQVQDGSGNEVAVFSANNGFRVKTTGNAAWMNLGTDGAATPVLDVFDAASALKVRIDGNGYTKLDRVGFQGTSPIAKPTVSGSKGANAALGSLLTALASYGLITDSST